MALAMRGSKKRNTEKASLRLPNCNFEELYYRYIYTRNFPEFYDFNSNEMAVEIIDCNIEILKDFFDQEKIETKSNAVYMLDKNTYEKIISYLFTKAKNISLYDISNGKTNLAEAKVLVDFCKNASQKRVDFSKEFVVFEQSC